MSDVQLHLNLVPATKEDLYKTPLCSEEDSPNVNNNSESIEILATPSNNNSSGQLQESITSVSSTNTDIWVLENHYDYYGNDQFADVIDEDYIKDSEDNEYLYDDLDSDEEFIRSIGVRENLGQFTVVHKSQKSKIFGTGKKSVDKMKNLTSDYGKQGPMYSGTDSDVEVLVEGVEIVECGWPVDDIPWSAVLSKDGKKASDNTAIDSRNQASDVPCTLEGYSKNGLDYKHVEDQKQQEYAISNTYENLSRSQLLEIIKQQELHIKTLESNLLNYQKAQQKMCEHVNALRLELSEMSVTPSVLPKH